MFVCLFVWLRFFCFGLKFSTISVVYVCLRRPRTQKCLISSDKTPDLKNGQTDRFSECLTSSLFLADELSAPSLVRACKCSPLSWSCEAALFLVPPACLLKVGISMIWVPGLRDRAGDREKMLWFRICILMALTQEQEVGGEHKGRNYFQGHVRPALAT